MSHERELLNDDLRLLTRRIAALRKTEFADSWRLTFARDMVRVALRRIDEAIGGTVEIGGKK